MTITTKEAERFARWCDTDGFTERATALRSLAAERDALRAENARLREALKAADWVIQWTGADLLNGNPYSKVLASYQEYRHAALGEKE